MSHNNTAMQHHAQTTRLHQLTRIAAAGVIALLFAQSAIASPLAFLFQQDDNAKEKAGTADLENKDSDKNDKPDKPAPDKTDKTPAPPAPADPDQPVTALSATITKIQGRVQIRKAQAKAWVVAKVGMKIGGGDDIRTGLRSKVELVIPPDEVITIDRLTTIKLLRVQRTGEKRQTDIGMKYGRTRYEVEEAGVEHETTIRSPSATLAVRGTIVTLSDHPGFIAHAYCSDGRAVFTNIKRQRIAFGRAKQVRVDSDRNSVAQTAAYARRVDPGNHYSRTEPEDRLLVAYPSLVGAHHNVLRPNKGSQASQMGSVQGNLEFSLSWSGGAADLDLFVISPLGETISVAPSPLKIVQPNGNPMVASGGVHSGDDMTAFPTGNETVRWTGTFPAGKFSLGVQYHSGTGPAAFQVDVTQVRPNQSPTTKSLSGSLDAQNPIFIPNQPLRVGGQ